MNELNEILNHKNTFIYDNDIVGVSVLNRNKLFNKKYEMKIAGYREIFGGNTIFEKTKNALLRVVENNEILGTYPQDKIENTVKIIKLMKFKEARYFFATGDKPLMIIVENMYNKLLIFLIAPKVVEVD